MIALSDALIKKRKQYEPAFILLIGDFLRVCEFVELTDNHLQVYSYRLYEILLRACTEFESLCREILAACGPVKQGNLNITDFVEIAPLFDLQKQTCIALFWRPEPLLITHFEHWTPQATGLLWYRGYNAVKHNHGTASPIQESCAAWTQSEYSQYLIGCPIPAVQRWRD